MIGIKIVSGFRFQVSSLVQSFKFHHLSTMLYIIASLYSLKYFNSPKLIFNSFPTDFRIFSTAFTRVSHEA